MVLSLAACGKKDAPEWSRTGYFSDGSNLVSITKSEDKEHPGWMVGAFVEEGMYGWYIQQEGSELKGNLTAEYQTDTDPFIVTISEEGADGIKMTIQWYLDNQKWWKDIISGEYMAYYEKMYGNR